MLHIHYLQSQRYYTQLIYRYPPWKLMLSMISMQIWETHVVMQKLFKDKDIGSSDVDFNNEKREI